MWHGECIPYEGKGDKNMRQDQWVLAEMYGYCAVQGCVEAATRRDPRPLRYPAFYYLCEQHFVAAERQAMKDTARGIN